VKLSGPVPAIAAVFFSNGVFYSSWVSRIPGVKESAGLSPARLGLALFAMACGTVLSLPLTSLIIGRAGSRKVTVWSGLGCCVILPLCGLAPSLPLLAATLMLLGASFGSMDVSMNAQAAAAEKVAGRSIMARLHGLWSLGGLVGASLGGRLAASGVSPLWHFALVAVVLAPIILVASGPLDRREGIATQHQPFAIPSRAVLGVGLVAVCAAVVEGGIADWSGVYLRGLGTGTGLAAAGYAAFSLAMTVGRLSGDLLIDRFGPIALLRAGSALAATALAVGLASHSPAVSVVCFAVTGIGMSPVFPVAFSAAGNIPGTAPSAAIAAVATMAYGAGLAGPPGIGFIASATSLPLALVVLVVLGSTIAVLAGNAASHPHRATSS
jgi:MFS family permease